MPPIVTRRRFLATSSGAVAALTARDPSRGHVVLLDGRVLEVTHPQGMGIAPGRSVLIAPEVDGSWSVLYADISA